jgi:hypothetical protein
MAGVIWVALAEASVVLATFVDDINAAAADIPAMSATVLATSLIIKLPFLGMARKDSSR